MAAPAWGLTICRKLVEIMGGRIWLQSQEGQGSTFHFTVAMGVAPGLSTPPMPVPTAQLQGLRALVVDDNPAARRILAAELSDLGMRFTAVGSAGTALAVLQDSLEAGAPFALALVDYNMPGMDGFEMIRRLLKAATKSQYQGHHAYLDRPQGRCRPLPRTGGQRLSDQAGQTAGVAEGHRAGPGR